MPEDLIVCVVFPASDGNMTLWRSARIPNCVLKLARYPSSRIDDWSFAYQSAGQTGEKWLGPDIVEALNQLSRSGERDHVLVVPIGFVADHLEVLYDIDFEAQLFASAHRLNLKRTESLNTSPTFINALADIVRKRLN